LYFVGWLIHSFRILIFSAISFDIFSSVLNRDSCSSVRVRDIRRSTTLELCQNWFCSASCFLASRDRELSKK
jgi:hypothetical protein